MEIKARYVLVGAFVLVVIAGVFSFVYWLETISGRGERAVYRVRFERTVSGLRPGSAVLFNGLRVGEVTELALDPGSPERITATIAIQKATPVRTDTRVDVDVQGLMGTPSVLLQGGTPQAPRLGSVVGEPLVAGPGAGADTMQTARQALRRIDDLLAANAEPLHATIANFETFSNALARNSDRIDGILTGVERMTGTGPPARAPTIANLTAPQAFPALKKPGHGQLVVPEPTGLLTFDTQRILVLPSDSDGPNFAGTQWSDHLPKLLQSKIVESFENAKSIGAVALPTEGLIADSQLLIGIRAFQISLSPRPEAQVEFSAKILGRDGKIIGTRVFRNTVPLETVAAGAATAALDQAFGQAVIDLVVWASSQV
jgi:phospholipid/cholesterol/gamma-HCH transport system substrate-binding protein